MGKRPLRPTFDDCVWTAVMLAMGALILTLFFISKMGI